MGCLIHQNRERDDASALKFAANDGSTDHRGRLPFNCLATEQLSTRVTSSVLENTFG